MYGWDAIMLPPIVRHLIRQLAVPSQLVKEEFGVKLPAMSVLDDKDRWGLSGSQILKWMVWTVRSRLWFEIGSS